MRSRTTKYAPFCGRGFSLFFIRILPSGEAPPNFRRKFCGVDWRSALSAPIFRPLTYGKYAASPEYGGFRASHLNIALRRGRVGAPATISAGNFVGYECGRVRLSTLPFAEGVFPCSSSEYCPQERALGSPTNFRRKFGGVNFRGPRRKYFRWGRSASNCVKAHSAQGSPRKIRKDFAWGQKFGIY